MKRFKKVYIEITNVCNLKCSFCPGPDLNRSAGFLEPGRFSHILSQLKGFTSRLYFHVMGEPLLHHELSSLLDLSGKAGFLVDVTTNGTLIGKKSEQLLKADSLRQVNFSLQSFESNFPGVPPDEYIGNIFEFINKARYNGRPNIALRLWNIDSRQEAPSGYLNTYFLERIKENFPIEADISQSTTPINGLKLAHGVFLHIAGVFEWPDQTGGEARQAGFCHGLRDQVAVLLDGTVVPCCLDRCGALSLGNIYEQSFKDIIMSERATRIYEGFSRRLAVEELCRKCTYRERF